MSNQVEIIAPTTDADQNKKTLDATNYAWVNIVADNLAGSEEVDIFVRAGTTWVRAPNKDLDGPAVLTATISTLTLQGGLEYALDKDATAGACGVSATFGKHRLEY